ncbi:hypothetical protein A7982_12932 [Minicystis rosea]|nr:hypothetical protein A7982_12932 [Minicystis rosea]
MPRRILALAAIASSLAAAAPAFADDCAEGRLQAEELFAAAGKATDREAAWDRYAQAGEAYWALWQKHGEAPLRAHTAPTCAKLEEVLYNASKAFQAARDITRANAIGLVLVDPKNGFAATLLARKMVHDMGARYHALAEYAEAVRWYERYARENPKEEKAKDVLLDAVVLRLGLGDERAALANAELYDKTYGAAQRERSAQIAFALAAHEVDRERWAAAEKRFATAETRIDRDGSLALRLQMHAQRGRVLQKLGKAREAAAQHRLVLDLLHRPQTMRQMVMAGDDRMLGKALMAAGESLVYFAEEAAQKARAVRLPAYRGKRDREAMARWVDDVFARALGERRAAIGAAEKIHAQVSDLQPVPPPRWVVVASVSATGLWAELADEIGALAVMDGKKPDPMLAAALAPARDAARVRLLAAARTCVSLGGKFAWQAADSSYCAEVLTREFPAAHPRLDEILPRPRWMASGLSARFEP